MSSICPLSRRVLYLPVALSFIAVHVALIFNHPPFYNPNLLKRNRVNMNVTLDICIEPLTHAPATEKSITFRSGEWAWFFIPAAVWAILLCVYLIYWRINKLRQESGSFEDVEKVAEGVQGTERLGLRQQKPPSASNRWDATFKKVERRPRAIP